MKRYAVVQKARDADVFGILIGTLGVGTSLQSSLHTWRFSDDWYIASYLPLISHLRTVLANAHKKTYTVSVGKLNPSKLGNFLEIECWVLVACPENSMVESKVRLRFILCYIIGHHVLTVGMNEGVLKAHRHTFRAGDRSTIRTKLDGEVCTRF